MSKRDVDEYYNKICRDRELALEDLKELEKELTENLVNPDIIENYKKSIQPIIDNYQQISYIMWLFNKPVNKKKINTYTNQTKKFLAQIESHNTTDAKLNQNKEILNNLRVNKL